MIKAVFNILTICGAAGFAGVMLSIGVTLGGYWRSLPTQEFLDWFATNNQFVSRSIPMIFVPLSWVLLGQSGCLGVHLSFGIGFLALHTF